MPSRREKFGGKGCELLKSGRRAATDGAEHHQGEGSVADLPTLPSGRAEWSREGHGVAWAATGGKDGGCQGDEEASASGARCRRRGRWKPRSDTMFVRKLHGGAAQVHEPQVRERD